jgi:hypothetical protein
MCTPTLQFAGNSHQVINDYKNTRVLFNFKTLKGVAVFPQSWILYLFFRMDHTSDPNKSRTLCEHCTLVFSHLMTISFVANDKLFLYSFTVAFLCMYFHAFDSLWIIMAKKIQNKTKKSYAIPHNLVNKTNLVHNFFNIFISVLCGWLSYSYPHRITTTKCHINTVVSPDYGLTVAWNM